MDDLEKVIGRLNEAAEYFRECRSNASLGSKAEEHFWEMQSAMREAAERLKAQEPRVMTLEEVLEQNWDYCYLEYDAVRGREAQIFSGGRHRLTCVTWPSITSMRLSPGDKEYGKRWRCWTSRPTDEQREAVKWDE